MALLNPPVLGILMLKTGFPRLLGDVGNPATWPCRCLYKVVEPASVATVVTGGPLPAALVDAFAEAGAALVAGGASLLTTSCGFLVTAQAELQDRLPVPLVTSSLLQIPTVAAGLPAGRSVGVITFDSRRLSPGHLAAAGAPPDTPVAGLEDGWELHGVITRDLPQLDRAAAEADVLKAAQALTQAHPELGALVLECTNLPPYRAALEAALGLPVHDLVSLICNNHLEPVFLRRGDATPGGSSVV
ncbi:aspartate/glutamate racemase family protein [Pelagibius litoralis]|uniref:Aspartate/glutamate racemase family protein n=1 Tax=Pelagibius litoralis TaxID=374515 RepID=A0A967C8Q6_9PROT|nr:aspartate/glutamate racemase family protein [Pelagibius litoralis]NIA68587.1 aspartate/glutamate racemase family protein [Pelagibius litoralis]